MDMGGAVARVDGEQNSKSPPYRNSKNHSIRREDTSFGRVGNEGVGLFGVLP